MVSHDTVTNLNPLSPKLRVTTHRLSLRRTYKCDSEIFLCSFLYLTPTGVHLIKGSLQRRVGGLDQLHLSAHVALHVGTHQEIVLPPFLRGQASFGLDDRVDASNFARATNMTDVRTQS